MNMSDTMHVSHCMVRTATDDNDVQLVVCYNVPGMTGTNCSSFYPRMQCMAKVSEMYVRHHGTAQGLLRMT